MWGIARRNEQNSIETEGFTGLTGDRDMAVVNGIERPAENTETGWFRRRRLRSEG